ncbi:hypothetical protein OAO01_06390 [Oligoflexia bacterium]|nr:hypothetical protein [Oligoflexia bacterium]
MLRKIFHRLDEWIIAENKRAVEGSGRLISSCTFTVLGQSALLEAQLDLELAQTADVDVYNDASYAIIRKLESLLNEKGLHLDPLGAEIWMPKEVKCFEKFNGEYVRMLVAEAQYVMVSKALKAPEKNKELISQYLASEPPNTFSELCNNYGVDLNFFVS